MEAVGDYVLLEQVASEQKIGEFDVPDPEDEPVFLVLKVGPDVDRCKEGDKVFCYRAVEPFRTGGKDYWLAGNDQIALVVE